MKIKTALIIFLFSFPIYGQINAELNQKLEKINTQVKFIDSVANYYKEEVSLGEVKTGHGRTDGKPIRKLYTYTRITKSSNKVIRICYRERYPDYDEDLSLYFFENKLIYAERSRWKGKRNKFSTEKFYYEDNFQISDKISENYPIDGIDILIRAEELMNQASR